MSSGYVYFIRLNLNSTTTTATTGRKKCKKKEENDKNFNMKIENIIEKPLFYVPFIIIITFIFILI
jgi:hypothetical protein